MKSKIQLKNPRPKLAGHKTGAKELNAGGTINIDTSTYSDERTEASVHKNLHASTETAHKQIYSIMADRDHKTTIALEQIRHLNIRAGAQEGRGDRVTFHTLDHTRHGSRPEPWPSMEATGHVWKRGSRAQNSTRRMMVGKEAGLISKANKNYLPIH